MKSIKPLIFFLIISCSLEFCNMSAQELETALWVVTEPVPQATSSEFISDEVFIEGIGKVSVSELVRQTPVTISEEDLPSRYDATEEGLITPVKNQENYGTCWAFSSISAIETNMIKKGFENVYNVDYSELHHSYFTHAKNTSFGDGQSKYSTDYGYYGGDNPINSSSYLIGWQGVTNEENFPYPPPKKDYTIPEDYRYESVAHLQDFLRISPDCNSIKKAISEYGSVSASYYDSDNHSDNYAYYQSTEMTPNHSITIVGWDNNYAVSNFDGLKSTPTAPGAWRVKNSWGEHWGDNGYFWISYQEPSLQGFCAFNAEPADNYQLLHQYDGASPEIYAESGVAANIFTAEQNEELHAVGFYNITAGVTYSVEVYSLNYKDTSPVQGTLVSSTSGSVSNIGYHTVTLDTPVALKENERFSVVVSLSDGYFAFEGNNGISQSRQSFIYINQNWQDAKTTPIKNTNPKKYLNNACIKAYAQKERFNVYFQENGGSEVPDTTGFLDSYLDVPKSPSQDGKFFAGWYKDSALTSEWDFDTDTVTSDTTLYAAWSDTPIPIEKITLSLEAPGLYTGDSKALSCNFSPYYATNKNVLWKSSSTGISVSDGVVTGIRKGTYTITATAEDGSGIYDTIRIRVLAPMNDIQIITTKPVYSTSETVEYTISGNNAERFDFYIILPSGVTQYAPGAPKDKIFSLKDYSYSKDKYSCYTVAYDEFGNSVKSQLNHFWISDNPMLVAEETEDSYQTGGFNGGEASRVFVAYYKDDTLLSVVSPTANNTLATVENKKGADKVKIMWWNSDTGNSPITDFIEIDTVSGNRVGKTYTAK